MLLIKQRKRRENNLKLTKKVDRFFSMNVLEADKVDFIKRENFMAFID